MVYVNLFSNVPSAHFLASLDTTPPTITCPNNQNLAEPDMPPLPADDEASSSDTGPSGITDLTSSDNVVTATEPGPIRYTVERIWTATDPTGNSATCTTTYTVHG